jgi:hypothetical protein
MYATEIPNNYGNTLVFGENAKTAIAPVALKLWRGPPDAIQVSGWEAGPVGSITDRPVCFQRGARALLRQLVQCVFSRVDHVVQPRDRGF